MMKTANYQLLEDPTITFWLTVKNGSLLLNANGKVGGDRVILEINPEGLLELRTGHHLDGLSFDKAGRIRQEPLPPF